MTQAMGILIHCLVCNVIDMVVMIFVKYSLEKSDAAARIRELELHHSTDLLFCKSLTDRLIKATGDREVGGRGERNGTSTHETKLV